MSFLCKMLSSTDLSPLKVFSAKCSLLLIYESFLCKCSTLASTDLRKFSPQNAHYYWSVKVLSLESFPVYCNASPAHWRELGSGHSGTVSVTDVGMWAWQIRFQWSRITTKCTSYNITLNTVTALHARANTCTIQYRDDGVFIKQRSLVCDSCYC